MSKNKNKSINQSSQQKGDDLPKLKEDVNPSLKEDEIKKIKSEIATTKIKLRTLLAKNQNQQHNPEAEKLFYKVKELEAKLLPPQKNPFASDSFVSKKETTVEYDKTLMALVMMVKNEEKRIRVSFDSVKDYTDTFIILDTGSTDTTIEICKEYCKEHGITLHLKEDTFVNFCYSRNVLLDWCDEALKKPRYLLQLDCNDELRNHKELMEFMTTYKGPATGFYLKQQWWTGNNMDSYFNIRMCKSHAKWRYKGVVHEYIIQDGLSQKDLAKAGGRTTERLENIVLFQDRTLDDDKSFKRFSRDKDMLYSEFLKEPKDPRTLFYLAQTCGCLGNMQDAYRFYLLRINNEDVGFVEEVYQSYFRLGEICQVLGHPWQESVDWYMKAYAHSQRAEPLIKLAEHYIQQDHFNNNKPDYMLAYMYASMACKLIFPYNQILFVDRRCYFYKRWHTLGVIAYHVQQYKEGAEACTKALMAEGDDADMKNLVRYMKREKEIVGQQQLGQGIPFTCLTVLDSEKAGLIYPPDQVKQEKEVEHIKMTREAILSKARGMM